MFTGDTTAVPHTPPPPSISHPNLNNVGQSGGSATPYLFLILLLQGGGDQEQPSLYDSGLQWGKKVSNIY